MMNFILIFFVVEKNFQKKYKGDAVKNKSLTPASQFLFFWGIFNWRELI